MTNEQLAAIEQKMGKAFYIDVCRLETKLARIKAWCEAYPLAVFPEPDWARAQELLTAGGMTLDAISASNMRHVLRGVCEIIEETP